MNVTHVTPYMHPNAGGPPVVVDRLARRQAACGHTVRVVTTDATAKGDSGWEAFYADSGYELEVHPARGGAFAFARSLTDALRTAVAGSDVVHLHTVWTYPTLRAAWACRRLGVPYVVMPHGMLDPNSVRRKRLKKWVYSHVAEAPNLRRAAGMVYTHAEEERLARETIRGLPPGFVAPLGADDPPGSREELASAFGHAGVPASARLILFLGRLHPKKGLDLLVPAFARLAARFPDAHLVLAGPGDPDYVAQVRADLVARGVGDRATLTGPLTGRAKWAALAAATVFVLPSYQENFALTVAEALRVGTPVVLSRRVNIWSDVVAAGAGLDTDLSPDAVADRVAAVLADPAAAAVLGRNGQRFAETVYDWDRTAAAVESAYHAATRTRAVNR